ncbi:MULTISPECIES: lipoate--protein ligase family protein [Aeromicrobium]|uniref:Lipoate--protein ligase family protein n=1 Tax=Aeromicrobium yanjiei TaxID=2662028 RepID=A0A5Q2MMU4_9ACTN|nr:MULTISPECIES: biotin/lipoate A/B protein ligase family protein [Aeromicrobium]MRK02498.1 lipoate--protein ligase family protein [Aeromicrobium sp. S22]QGG43103.1 lipoate--protein ligase family protein [Aeromicrobium yanjiei]
MHGEYKVSGGKLVVVDLEVSDGRIRDVVLSGDFFLEPDEALGRMSDALEGRPADASLGELVQAIDDARGDAVMVGFDPPAVAHAVLRALGRSTAWHDHRFELLIAGPQHPAEQMAIDEIVARQVGEGTRAPTLRVWEWASNAVIIGSFQSLSNEVDLDAAARHEATVVRRISGGGAMFVEPGNTITYSLYVPATLVEGLSFAESYAFLDAWVIRALRQLGVDASYVPLNDIASPQGKIGGAAQKRLASGVVLHHVTMSYDMDAAKMLDILRIGREKLSDKGTVSAAKRVDPIRSQTGLSREKVVEAMLDHFRASYGLTEVEIDTDTIEEADALAESKYLDPAWTARVP